MFEANIKNVMEDGIQVFLLDDSAFILLLLLI